MSLTDLPYELVAFVVHHLDLAEVYSLSLTCKRFQFLVHEPSIAKAQLESKAPGSQEAQTARRTNRYAAELRRLVKRREAISKVSPFLIAIVAVAESWIFENGVLCYIHDRQLRVLDLNRPRSGEVVICIRKLLDEAINESHNSRRYRFQLLYYARDIVSCVYTHAKPEQISWLIVFHPWQGRILTTHRLDSSFKIFVRNNDKFLYYGTNSEYGRDGYRHWVIRSFDIENRRWLENQKLELTEMVGSDIGSTVCFEIFDNYFYGLANQTAFEVEEIDWTSYYTCFRFPTSQRGFQLVEEAPRERMWRRSHAEGPIDDRWGFLKMFRDESTSELRIVESRKEWLAGHSSARRTYYTTNIDFDSADDERTQCSVPDSSHLNVDSDSDDDDDEPAPFEKGHPYSMDAPLRSPHEVHPGDDGSTSLMYTLSKCPIRTYHPSSQTFLDLVDDPSNSEPNEQRIRIRGGSRRRRTPSELEERNRTSSTTGQEFPYTFEQTIQDIYKQEDVVFWPPDQDVGKPDPALVELYKILSPPGHQGNIQGAWDDRSVVYSTGSMPGGLSPLILLSFDPSLYLVGVRPFPNSRVPNKAPAKSDKSRGDSQLQPHSHPSCEEKGKGRETKQRHPTSEPDAAHCLGGMAMSSETANDDHRCEWRVFEHPMYQDISVGYQFAL
ncbi:hypothetical protein B0H63DRAFT_440690 [Podospora didyma]|uniref:F-box domain-containing protein n=1 Tax=Podospora didyma TaxID=330526 RepID=A0AAE0N5L6_9PEZI|nr:hypothetical protein B0H63DRAFT_440690 [Podospora didyma]